MAIVTIGFCEDCYITVDIDFDPDSGAALCSSCGGFEVFDIESYVTEDEDDDELTLGLEELEDDEDDDGEIVDDEF